MSEPQKILFVCLGNICRSPLAEVIVRQRAAERNLATRFSFASAGTGSWHVGNPADPRSAAVASTHQLSLASHRAQQIHAINCHQWHWYVAMDQANWRDLLTMGVKKDRLLLLRQFELSTDHDVPDPYYGGPDGFELVFQIIQQNANPLLDWLCTQTAC